MHASSAGPSVYRCRTRRLVFDEVTLVVIVVVKTQKENDMEIESVKDKGQSNEGGLEGKQARMTEMV